MDSKVEILGNSKVMRELRETISRFALTELPVLICGESGTGKQLVAEWIHGRSQRAGKPFVTVDCGSIAPALCEAELFGAVKGAFTGADRDRVGLLESAGGGTVFLDEIGELPYELQTRLLRAVDRREIRRVGSTITVTLDVRFIAATNRPIEKDVRAGRFRADLYYRLTPVVVNVPALRERPDDIKLLAESFLGRLGGCHWVLSGALVSFMENYAWPGNARELKNCIAYMTALSAGPALDICHLPRDMLVRHAQCGREAIIAAVSGGLREMEAAAIARAIEASNGNRACAAKLLGIGKSTLYRKLKSLGLA